jgi:SAUR family protein
MCNVITIALVARLRRAVRRWRTRGSAAVPAGHVAVCAEGARFVVRLAHLAHPAFVELLRQAEEEYGFASTSGPVALPCDEDRLRDVLHRVSSSSGEGRSFRGRRGDTRPLMQDMAVERLVL